MPSPRLQIYLLGSFRLLLDNQPVAGFEQPRLQHLLAYLVLHRAAPVSRQQLAFAFWPETTDQQALKNLRTLLTRMRAALAGTLAGADRFVEVTGQTVWWRQDDGCTVDTAEFEAAVAQAAGDACSDRAGAARALEAAVAAYGGDLLPDCYDEWILPLRDQLHQAYGDALERLVLLLEEQREYRSALRHARRLLYHDILHESAYHHLMRLNLALGDRTEALRVYRACEAMLSQEFGAGPGSPMRELYERVRAASEVPAPRLAAEVQKVGHSAAQEPELALVGRRAEWARLLAAWRDAAEGRPRIVLVSGEAGIGKTRLVEELCGRAAAQGAAVAVANCYPEGAGTAAAYAPVAEWLRSEALRPRLRSLPDVWLAEIARVAPSVALVGAAAERATSGEHPSGVLPGPWQRTRLFEALARGVLGAEGGAGSPPLLLFLDDLQWCDQETLDWLGYLLRYAPRARLLVVATVRKDEIDTRHPLMAFWLTLTRAGLLDEILLAPLDATETATLAAHVAGKPLDASATERIYRNTEGNPLFVVETVRAGLDDDESGAREADSAPAPAVLPAKVRAVIGWRLAQLSPPAQALAQVAAAIGRRFSFDVLARASGQDETLLLDGLDELWRRHIVRAEGGSYDFSHEGIRAVAYDELGPIRRRTVHLRIARALEELNGEPGELAYHYEQAGQVQLAVEHYRRAAATSRGLHANAAAAGFYGRLVEGELSEALPPAERCEVMFELAEVWREMGEWARMEALSRDALALAGTSGQPQVVARAQAALADAFQLLGYYEEALRWLAKAERGFRTTGDAAGVMNALRIAGEIDRRRGPRKRV